MNDIESLGTPPLEPLIFPATDEENWAEFPRIQVSYGSYYFNPGGKSKIQTPSQKQRKWTITYQSETTALQDLLLFFVTIRGRLKSFFFPVPEWLEDPVFESTTSLSFDGTMAFDIDYLWIQLDNGNIIFRKILDDSYSEETERTTLEFAEITIGLDTISKAREAILCTLANDEIDIEFEADEIAKTTLTFEVMLADEFA